MIYEKSQISPGYFGGQQEKREIDTSSILDKLKKSGAIPKEKSGLQKTADFFGEFGGGVENILGGVVANTPNMIGNTLGFIADVVTPKELEGAGDFLRSRGEKQQDALKNILGVDKDAFLTEMGELGSEIALAFTPGGASKLIQKAPNVARGLQTISQKSPKLYSIIKSGVAGAGDFAKFEVASEGELTKEGLTTGAALGVGAKLLGSGVKYTKNYFQKELPDKLASSGLVNPADLKNASERLAKLTGKEADITDVSRWIIKNGIKGDKSQVRNGIQEIIKTKKNLLGNKLSQNKDVISNDIVSDLQSALREKMLNYGKITKTGFKPSAGNEGVVDDILGIVNSDGLTLSQINQGRKIIGKDIFSKQGTMKEVASKEGWQNIWKNTSKYLDDTIDDFRVLNKDIEVGLALDKAIAKKEASDMAKQIASYLGFGLTGGGLLGAGQAITQGGNVGDIATAMLAGGLIGVTAGKAKNFLNSTKVKTNLAQMLSPLAPHEKRAVKEFIEYGRTEGLEISTIQKVNNFLNKKVGDLADDVATKVGGKANFVDDTIGTGKRLDDFGDDITDIAGEQLIKQDIDLQKAIKQVKKDELVEKLAKIEDENFRKILLEDIIK